MEKTNYMMTVDDVAQELGVSKQKGYRIIRQLNEELAAAGYMTVLLPQRRTIVKWEILCGITRMKC